MGDNPTLFLQVMSTVLHYSESTREADRLSALQVRFPPRTHSIYILQHAHSTHLSYFSTHPSTHPPTHPPTPSMSSKSTQLSPFP